MLSHSLGLILIFVNFGHLTKLSLLLLTNGHKNAFIALTFMYMISIFIAFTNMHLKSVFIALTYMNMINIFIAFTNMYLISVFIVLTSMYLMRAPTQANPCSLPSTSITAGSRERQTETSHRIGN